MGKKIGQSKKLTLNKKGGGPSQGAIARETSLKDDLGGAGRGEADL